MKRCCMKNKCSAVTIECRHCGKHCCSWHIQQELHMCDKLKTKEKIILEPIKTPKITKI